MGSNFTEYLPSTAKLCRLLLVVAIALLICACPEEELTDDGRASELAKKGMPELKLPGPSKVAELLGEGPLGQFAYGIYQGDGRAALDGLGFSPDHEERYAGRLDTGELIEFAPRVLRHVGWEGTAYIEGDPAEGDGCVAYQLEDGLVVWVHASVDWLEQRLSDDPLVSGGLSSQFRHYSYKSHLEDAEVQGGQSGTGWFTITLNARAIRCVLSERSLRAEPGSADRIDFYLANSRVDELRSGK